MKAFFATALVCSALVGSTAFSAEVDYPCEKPNFRRYNGPTSGETAKAQEAQEAQRAEQAQQQPQQPAVKPLTQTQYDCIVNSVQANQYGDVYGGTVTNEQVERILADREAYGHDVFVYTAHRICGIRHR